jgi:putative membrane protein
MVPRRTVLVALAAAVGHPSFAQTQSDPTPGGDAGADEQYIQETSAAGSFSLAASRLAQEKAQTDDLKEFAQLEVAEQEILANVLKSLRDPSGLIDGTVKPPSDTELEQHLDRRGREGLEKMRAAPAGTEFDREYLAAQATGHLELLRIQETYLNSGRNRDFINVAKLARGMVKEHLQLLADIESEIDFSGGTTGAAPERDNE